MFVDLQGVYPDFENPMASEFSFEELRAKHRGWMDYKWDTPEQKKPEATKEPLKESVPRTYEKPQDSPSAQKQPARVPVKGLNEPIAENLDLNDENAVPSKAELDKAKMARKARREERANRTRKIKVMEVREIRAETQTSRQYLRFTMCDADVI